MTTPKYSRNPLSIVPDEVARRYYLELESEFNRNGAELTDKIKTFRSIFEEFFFYLCKDEPRALRDQFARMCFIFDKYNMHGRIANEAHSFRKLANRITHSRGSRVNEQEYAGAIQAICLTIHHFSGEEISPHLQRFWEQYPNLTLVKPDRDPGELIEFDRAVVTEIKFDKEYNKYILTCQSEGDLGFYKLHLKDQRLPREGESRYGQSFAQIGRRLWQFATLHLFKIFADKTYTREYHVRYMSMVVVEPDFLIDATFLARSFFEQRTRLGARGRAGRRPCARHR